MAQEILDPVKVATSVNINLTAGVVLDSAESTIDGVTLIVGDRILVKSQTNKVQNGIYEVSNTNVAGTTRKALVRTSDFALAATRLASIVFVRRGELFADTGWIIRNDEAVVVGTSEIEFKRFTVNSLENLSEVTSFLTLREEKGYPLTNAELDNNFKYLGNALDDKVDIEDYSAEAIIDKINSLSYEEAGIDASLLRGKAPSVTVPISTPKPETIVVRDTDGNITTTNFIGDLDGTAELLRKGTTGRNGDFYTNVNNVDAGILPILHGGTGANNASQARTNLNVVNKSGDTMNGILVFKAGQDGISGNSSLRITPGVVLPTITEDGDVWSSGSFLYYKLNSTVEKIAHINSPIFTGSPKINAVVPNLNSSGNITGDSQLIATIGFVQKLKDEFIDPQLNLKAPIASPTFTGAAYLQYSALPGVANNSNMLATAEWVQSVKTDFLTNTIQPTYETIANVALKAPIASPTFTGYAYVNYTGLPGPANNSNILATTEWVQTVRTDLINNTLVPTYATYSYVNSSAPWKGSNKFVSSTLPTQSDGVAGDIWIQTTDILDESELNNSAYVLKGGDAMSGYLTLVGAPTNANHAATKNYVDISISDTVSNYVKKDGSVALTGALTLSGAPTESNHATSKSYVDTAISNIDVSTTAVMKNITATQTMIGKLRTSLTSASDESSTVTTKDYVDNLASGKVSKSGDTMSGYLTLVGAPTNTNHAATKEYVDTSSDTRVSKSGDTMTGFLTLHATPTSNMHAATKEYVDTKFSQVPTTADVFVNTAGDAMTGFLTLHANPVNSFHAVTKTYVDTQVSSKHFIINYGSNSVYNWDSNTIQNSNNYFDVFPPSGYAMSNLIGFIPSIRRVSFAGRVNADDTLRCEYDKLADRIRVWVQNSEQRARPTANWIAIWSNGNIGSIDSGNVVIEDPAPPPDPGAGSGFYLPDLGL